MAHYDYEDPLPVFVGHPFDAPHTETLRQAVSRACDTANANQPTSGKRFLWGAARFVNRLDHGAPASVLETIRDAIRNPLSLSSTSPTEPTSTCFSNWACHLAWDERWC